MFAAFFPSSYSNRNAAMYALYHLSIRIAIRLSGYSYSLAGPITTPATTQSLPQRTGACANNQRPRARSAERRAQCPERAMGVKREPLRFARFEHRSSSPRRGPGLRCRMPRASAAGAQQDADPRAAAGLFQVAVNPASMVNTLPIADAAPDEHNHSTPDAISSAVL